MGAGAGGTDYRGAGHSFAGHSGVLSGRGPKGPCPGGADASLCARPGDSDGPPP